MRGEVLQLTYLFKKCLVLSDDFVYMLQKLGLVLV
jgi:hypothetical protein